VNSFLRLAGRDLNFDPRGLLLAEYRIQPAEFMRPVGSYRGFPYYEISPLASQAMQRMYERLRTVPGVESVAAITQRPLNSILVPTMTVITDAVPEPGVNDSGPRTAAYFLVTPNFFSTMKAPWSAGRDFDARDVQSAPWVAVVNETMARTFWPGEDPIGKRFRLDTVPEEHPREVVGVVRDIPLSQLQTEPRPVIYASYLQQPSRYRGPWANMFGEMTFVLRSSGQAFEVVPATRAAMLEVDPKRPVTSLLPLGFDLELGLRRRRPFAMVFGSFAAVAMLLAAIGVYGVMAYAVAQHTREIGIRRALGATWLHVVSMVGRHAIVVVGAGMTAGLAGALMLTHLIETQLWGVTPTDPATFAAVSALLALVALLACVAPLRRAVRVDPTVALRCE
jgi:putative ABC transport system permease protein